MSDVGAEILQATIGSVASGPVGFGISYDIASGGTINGDSVTFDIGLNRQSLENAKGNLEHGNKDIAKMLEPPKPSRSMQHINGRNAMADDRYAALIPSAILPISAQHGLSRLTPHHNDYRILNPKIPMLRMERRKRKLLQLRKTCEDMLRSGKKSVAVNIERLPQHVLAKIAENAISKGCQLGGVAAKARLLITCNL